MNKGKLLIMPHMSASELVQKHQHLNSKAYTFTDFINLRKQIEKETKLTVKVMKHMDRDGYFVYLQDERKNKGIIYDLRLETA